MIRVTKCMTTETAHRLMNYEGKCAHIHGHSYRWEVTASLIAMDLPLNGIAIDFKELKAAMREAIFDKYDHALVLSIHDPLLRASEMQVAADGRGQRVVALDCNPTAENMARIARTEIQRYFEREYNPGTVLVELVRVWETADSHAESEGR